MDNPVFNVYEIRYTTETSKKAVPYRKKNVASLSVEGAIEKLKTLVKTGPIELLSVVLIASEVQ